MSSSILLNKSDENFDSARFLLEKDDEHFNSSAQCSYYGCLQVVKHLLIHQIYGSEEAIKNELKKYKAEGKKGNSHAFYISAVYKRLRRDGFTQFATTFNEHMVVLKTLREKSAYDEELLNKKQSQDALTKSFNLVKNLKNFYHI